MTLFISLVLLSWSLFFFFTVTNMDIGFMVVIICLPYFKKYVFIFNYVYVGDLPLEARRGRQVSWSGSHRWPWDSWCGCWGPNLGPVQEQVLFSTEPPPSASSTISSSSASWVLVRTPSLVTFWWHSVTFRSQSTHWLLLPASQRQLPCRFLVYNCRTISQTHVKSVVAAAS